MRRSFRSLTHSLQTCSQQLKRIGVRHSQNSRDDTRYSWTHSIQSVPKWSNFRKRCGGETHYHHGWVCRGGGKVTSQKNRSIIELAATPYENLQRRRSSQSGSRCWPDPPRPDDRRSSRICAPHERDHL